MTEAHTLYLLLSSQWKATRHLKGTVNAQDLDGTSLTFRQKKAKDRKKKVLIVDASKEFKTGRTQNELLPEHVKRICGWGRDYSDVEGIARLITLDEIAAKDHNIDIPRYVEPKVTSEVLTVEEAMKRLRGGGVCGRGEAGWFAHHRTSFVK